MQKFAAVEPDDDVLNGLAEIAVFLRRNRRQVHYLFQSGRLGDAVKKIGPRTIVGSKRKLSALLKGEGAS